MAKAKVFIYAIAHDGPAVVSNFKLIEEELKPLKNGGIFSICF